MTVAGPVTLQLSQVQNQTGPAAAWQEPVRTLVTPRGRKCPPLLLPDLCHLDAQHLSWGPTVGKGELCIYPGGRALPLSEQGSLEKTAGAWNNQQPPGENVWHS